LKYVAPPRAENLIRTSNELGRMLNSLIQSIRSPENIKRSVA